jgi:hypothetical protein
MPDTPELDPDSVTLDELFGTEQTPDARLTVKVSYSALFEGRPWYPHAEYGDGPRIVQYTDDDDVEQTIIESESDLRGRVIATAINALEETHAAAVAYLTSQKSKKESK